MATISDVAARAGVSIKTVSRVINGEPYVSKGTRTRVVASMRELGYAANVSAQRLASGRTNALGFVFHNPSWHYIQTALQGVLHAGRANGFETVLHPCDVEDVADYRRVLQLIIRRKVDGLIFTPPCDVMEPVIAELLAGGGQFVCLTPRDRSGRFPVVAADDRRGACEMTHHLLSLGHRRIGFIIGSALQIASADRLAGYRDALKEGTVAYDSRLVVQGDFDFGSGVTAAETLLSLTEPPTAIFASNDDMAAGVLAVAHDRGYAVPAQLSVVGFDNTPLSTQVWPALTTVHQPVYDIAATATQVLVRSLHGESNIAQVQILPTHLVLRQTSAAPR